MHVSHSRDRDDDPAGLSALLVQDLRDLARTRQLLVGIDFDGTIAPLVDEPSNARALPEALSAIERLTALPHTRVALLSGRSLADLQEVSGVGEQVLLAGSHGAEIRLDDAESLVGLDEAERALLERLRERLVAVADDFPNVRLEHKPAGVTLHTRTAGPDEARGALARARAAMAAEMDSLKVRGGKDVLEFAVRATTKGDALLTLKRHTGATAVFFAGDDVTDEDVFTVLEGSDLGLKSGPGATSADHRVAGPAEVALVLDRLADFREDPSEPGLSG